MTTDGEVTFYNKEEDWELKFPIEPLLKNEVFAAMLAGQFQEANTKRICLHSYSLPVILRFIRDLLGKQHNMYSHDPVTIGHQLFQSVRLAHQFNEQHLVHLYADQLCTSLFGSGFVVHLQTKQEERTARYEFCKLVYDLSLSDYYDKAYQLLCQRPDPLFIYDDFLLMKSICHKNVGVTKVWLSLAAKHKAYKCMQVIIEEIAFSNSEIQYYHCLANKDLELPEDLLQLIVSKYSSLVDNFLFHQQTSGLGAILRFNPDNFSFWHKVFEDGHLALVKFAPKSILTETKDSNSFGLTAVRNGWVNCVEILLAEGWDPGQLPLSTLPSHFKIHA